MIVCRWLLFDCLNTHHFSSWSYLIPTSIKQDTFPNQWNAQCWDASSATRSKTSYLISRFYIARNGSLDLKFGYSERKQRTRTFPRANPPAQPAFRVQDSAAEFTLASRTAGPSTGRSLPIAAAYFARDLVLGVDERAGKAVPGRSGRNCKTGNARVFSVAHEKKQAWKKTTESFPQSQRTDAFKTCIIG